MTREFRPKLSPGILPAQESINLELYNDSNEIVTFLCISKETDLVYKLFGECGLGFTLNCQTGLGVAKKNVSLNRDICFIQL